MSWREPIWALAWLLVVALSVILAFAGQVHRRRLAAWFEGELLERVLPHRIRMRRLARDLLALGGLAFVVLALIEPLYGKEVQEIEKTGVDIVLVVDLSRSMDATDVDPSRLERARREILDLIGMLQEDRVGLVIYAGGAYPRMPLTEDYDALKMLVGELDTDTFEAQGSAIGEGIRTAADLLSGKASERAGKAIILFTDGEAHDPADAMAAARAAAKADIRIYTVGIGEQAAPIPLKNGGFVTENGKTVLSTPDFKLLKDLARIGGGAYVQSVASASDMQQLYRDEIRKNLKAERYGQEEEESWKSGFQWPLGIGFLALLLSAWLGDGRRPWGGIAAALLAVGLFAATPARAATLAEGDAAYRVGDYGKAVELFTELSMERPTDADVYDRLGAARYRKGDYEGAARAWDNAAQLRGKGDVKDLYNSGNAHYKAGQLEKARERYDAVLNRDPKDEQARKNLELLQKELAERVATRPPPPPQGSSQDQKQQQGKQGKQQQGTSDQQQQGQQGQQGQGQPQQGQQQQGKHGQQGQQGQQQGQPPQGQPQPGQQGQKQPGQPGSPDQTGQDAEGSRQPGDDGQQRQGDGTSGTVKPEDVDQQGDEPKTAQGDPFDGRWEHDGPVTASQAKRLLDGVREGRPRIIVPGRDAGKPW